MPKWLNPKRFAKHVTPGSRIVERYRCSCTKKFKNLDALRLHLATSAAHTDDKRHQCTTCDVTFDKFEDLALHLLSETSHMRIRSECYKPAHETSRAAPKVRTSVYRVVALEDTSANRYHCRRCFQSFYGLEGLLHHLEHGKRHEKLKHQCQTCKTAFGSGDDLEAHLVWSLHMRLPRQGTAGEAPASAKFEGRQDVGVTSAAAESGDTSVDMIKTPVSVENADHVSYFIVDENAGTRIATDNVPPCWDDCCQGRGSSFKTMQAYREHAQETHGCCKHCYLIFATPELAEQHTIDTPFFCRQCRVCLPTKGEAAKHPAIPRPGSVSQTKPPVRRKGNSKRGPRSPFPYCKSCTTYYLKPSPGQLHRCGTKNRNTRDRERTAGGEQKSVEDVEDWWFG